MSLQIRGQDMYSIFKMQMLWFCREHSLTKRFCACLKCKIQHSRNYGSLNSDFHNYTIKAERLSLRHANIPNSALPWHCKEETDESDYGPRKLQFRSNTQTTVVCYGRAESGIPQWTAGASFKYNFNFQFLPFILLNMGITANHFNLIYPKIVVIHLSV